MNKKSQDYRYLWKLMNIYINFRITDFEPSLEALSKSKVNGRVYWIPGKKKSNTTIPKILSAGKWIQYIEFFFILL